MKTFDIAVVGGGASGLTAAISAKRADINASVAVIEKLPRVGKKILSTGNGRCNLSNRNIGEEHYHARSKELLKYTSGFSAEAFFRSVGVLCTADEEERIYPGSFSAASVLDALRLEGAKLGVQEICECPVTDIIPSDGRFVISGSEQITARSVIIAGGGSSQSSLGSDGSALEICRSLGIKINRIYPVLTPLKTDAAKTGALKGQRIRAEVSIITGGKTLGSEYGEVQFGDGVISGICVLDLSYLAEKNNSELSLDLLPEMSYEETLSLLKEISIVRADAALEDFLSGITGKRVGIFILKRCVDKPLSERVSSLTDNELRSITSQLKSLRCPVTGISGFEKSQATGGGIDISEITPELGSKRYSGMFFCGEILDIFGDCGG
ncbi:MAG: aminoacetone oxidase family FAD-binding enzyme, partial [Ruminiclostridium sp.]|nr:aminoacetone oxidase family FAD-binding enzyme [Ruminiclostridium sp.]